jgi:hypothetical protein
MKSQKLTVPATQRVYTESCSETAMLLGRLGTGLELWVHPYKLLDGLELFAELDGVLVPVKDLARAVSIHYPVFEVRCAHPSFRLLLTGCCPPGFPGALLVARITSDRAVALRAAFRPVLAPMWPGNLGGQYLEWDPAVRAFLFGEASGNLWGLFGARGAEAVTPPPAHQLPSGTPHLRVSVPRGKSYVAFTAALCSDLEEAYRHYKTSVRGSRRLLEESMRVGKKTDEATTKVTLPEKQLEDAFHWGKISLRSGAVTHPTLGRAIVAGIGPSGTSLRPGFAWFFAGDASANMNALCAIGETELAADTLELFLGVQREDGKIPHETSQSAHLIDWFGAYPYAFYHGETTAWLLVAAHEYLKWTGDRDFLQKYWPRLLKAFNYCISCDEDGDGLMENTAAGVGAAEVGPLRLNVGLDIYLASVWTAAVRAMTSMAIAVGEETTARQCTHLWVKARTSLNTRLWDPARRRFLYALDRKGRPRREDNAWGAAALSLRVAEEAKMRAAWPRFASSDLLTDWGARILSRRSRYYDPLHYNAGSVWPFLTGFVARAGLNIHQVPSAVPILRSLAALAFQEQPGHITEVLSGELACPLDASVPHQLFSVSGLVAGLIEGIVGIEPDLLAGRLIVRPELPLSWPEVEATVPLGDRRLRIGARFDDGHLEVDLQGAEHLNVLLQPRLGVLRPEVADVRLGREAVPPRLFRTAGDWHASLLVKERGGARLRVRLQRYLDILPESEPFETGQENRGLRFLWAESTEHGVRASVEGRAGRTYPLTITSKARVRLSGARRAPKTGTILVSFPPAASSRYLRRTIAFDCRR